jgi:DNA ligase-1
MNYPILYKLTATGAVQTWRAEVSGAQYRTHYGQLDGQLQTTAWTAVEGKNIGRSNETSPEVQAVKEVDALYTLQKKKGYRDTPDAAKSSDRFQCMLAEKYEDRLKQLYGAGGAARKVLYIQPKLDGIRCIATKDGLFSRQGNPIVAVPHVHAALAPLFEERPEAILDGELYSHTLKHDFNQIVSLVKKQKPTAEDLLKAEEMVEYWVYDTVVDIRFSDRHMLLSGMHTQFGGFVMVPTWGAHSQIEVDALYESCLEEGYEGAMVRVDGASYENKRSASLLKRKEFQDAEFEIADIEEGGGNATGMAKRAYMKLPDGRLFKADVVGTREVLREYLARRAQFIGKQATIVFQNYTPDGVPRFPKLKVVHESERW